LLHEMAHVRGALLAVELREEIRRRRSMLLLAVAGIALLHMALLFSSVLIAAVFWDSHRLGAIAAMVAFYFAGAGAAFLQLRRATIDSPPPFAASRRELTEDLAQLGTR
jgi:uncharacterized membrane protein YqjE